MKTSDALDKLAPAFVAMQGSIKPAIKDATNPAFRSKYADLSAVWEAVAEALQANGLAVTQLPEHGDGERAYLTTRLMHVSGQWMEATTSSPFVKQDPQGYGSAITYLRRYGLSALLGVITDVDDDANAASQRKVDKSTGEVTGRPAIATPQRKSGFPPQGCVSPITEPSEPAAAGSTAPPSAAAAPAANQAPVGAREAKPVVHPTGDLSTPAPAKPTTKSPGDGSVAQPSAPGGEVELASTGLIKMTVAWAKDKGAAGEELLRTHTLRGPLSSMSKRDVRAILTALEAL